MIKRNKAVLCFVMFFWIGGNICFGQDKVTDSLKKIRINVIDSIALTPVESCWLIVIDKDNKQLFSGFSDKNGLIELVIPVKRANEFIFNSNTYKIKRRKLDFSDRDAATIGLSTSTTLLKEVTILGSAVIRDADKLRYMVNTSKFVKGSDALTVLNDVPLLNVTGKDEVQIKNGNATVLLNGKPISNQLLRTIKVENILSVDVITNPSSSNSAEGSLNGIVNIKLKESDIPRLNGNLLFVGGLFRHMLFPGFSLNANSKKVYASFNMSHQSIKQDSKGRTEVVNNLGVLQSKQSNASDNSYNATSYSLDLYYNPTKFDQLSVSLAYAKTDIESLSTGNDLFTTTNDSFLNRNLYLQPFHSTSLNLEYNRKFVKGGNLVFSYELQKKVSEIASDFNTYSEISGPAEAKFDADIDKKSHSIQAIWSTKIFKEKISSELGGLFSLMDSRNQNESLNTGASSPMVDDIKLGQNLYSIFLTLRYNIRKYNFRVGGRLENLGQEYRSPIIGYDAKYHNFFPNLVAKRSLGKSFDLIFNYQRKISRPDVSILNPTLFKYSNLESYRGNPKLDPEFQNRYDLNLDYKGKNSFYELTLYAKYTKDQILYLLTRNGNTIDYNYVNINNLDQYGVSLSGKFNLSKTIRINSTAFVEHYAYDEPLRETTRPSGYDLGGNLNLYWNIPRLFSLSNSLSYKRLISFGFQNYQTGYPTYNLTLSRIFLNNKLFMAINFKDVFGDQARTRTYVDDLSFKQFRYSNSGTRDLIVQLSYSFGKTFYSNKSQTKLQSTEEQSFKKQ